MPDWRGYVREHLPPLACPPAREAEIVEEVAQQLQDIYAGALARGASAAEAEARVRDEIHDWRALARDLQQAEQPGPGGSENRGRSSTGACHAPISCLGLRLLEVLRDARLSVRALTARPLFTLTTVMTFALGIGATAVVFSLVHSVLLSPLPYRDPDRLTVVQQVIPEIADRVPILGVNPRSFTSWERACRTTCERMAALVASTSTLTGVGEPEGLTGARISPGLFDVLGIPPMYPDAASRARFFDALLDGLSREPGVAVAGLSRALPLEGLATVDGFVAVGDARPGLAQAVGSHVQVERRIFRRDRSAACCGDVC